MGKHAYYKKYCFGTGCSEKEIDTICRAGGITVEQLDDAVIY
jgi:hypothetical protein